MTRTLSKSHSNNKLENKIYTAEGIIFTETKRDIIINYYDVINSNLFPLNYLTRNNLILFANLAWPGDSKVLQTFGIRDKRPTSLPHIVEASHCPFNC